MVNQESFRTVPENPCLEKQNKQTIYITYIIHIYVYITYMYICPSTVSMLFNFTIIIFIHMGILPTWRSMPLESIGILEMQ